MGAGSQTRVQSCQKLVDDLDTVNPSLPIGFGSCAWLVEGCNGPSAATSAILEDSSTSLSVPCLGMFHSLHL